MLGGEEKCTLVASRCLLHCQLLSLIAGFNISLEPGFSVGRLCYLLAYNGVVAVANLR